LPISSCARLDGSNPITRLLKVGVP
jgi:hypothetical protein